MAAALVMVGAPVAGIRVSSCCRCPWQTQCLSPLGHRSLERALVSAPFQSVPLSLYVSLDGAVVWLVVAHVYAHSHLDCALLHCRCCLRKTRESQVFVPDAPRTT